MLLRIIEGNDIFQVVNLSIECGIKSHIDSWKKKLLTKYWILLIVWDFFRKICVLCREQIFLKCFIITIDITINDLRDKYKDGGAWSLTYFLCLFIGRLLHVFNVHDTCSHWISNPWILIMSYMKFSRRKRLLRV